MRELLFPVESNFPRLNLTRAAVFLLPSEGRFERIEPLCPNAFVSEKPLNIWASRQVRLALIAGVALHHRISTFLACAGLTFQTSKFGSTPNGRGHVMTRTEDEHKRRVAEAERRVAVCEPVRSSEKIPTTPAPKARNSARRCRVGSTAFPVVPPTRAR